MKKKDTIAEIYQSRVMNIEEWRAEGQSESFCPYYSSKNLLQNANLVLLPFSYLSDEKQFSFIEKYIPGSMLVFEEGHTLANNLVMVSR